MDIITEVSQLALHMALPQEGHLDAIFHVFAYLKAKHNSRMVFDPTYADIPVEWFNKMNQSDWQHFYGNVEEAKPLDAPKAQVKMLI